MNEDAAKKLALEYQSAHVGDWESLVASPDVDAVVVVAQYSAVVVKRSLCLMNQIAAVKHKMVCL